MYERSLFASALDELKIQVELQRNSDYSAIVESITTGVPSRIRQIAFSKCIHSLVP